jgi:hypothetical protein
MRHHHAHDPELNNIVRPLRQLCLFAGRQCNDFGSVTERLTYHVLWRLLSTFVFKAVVEG